MNVVEKANEVSVFGRWAAGVSQVTSPWEYSIRRNVPAFTKNITDDVTKIWSASSTLSWVLPRLGLLQNVFFKVDIDLKDTVVPNANTHATLSSTAAGQTNIADMPAVGAVGANDAAKLASALARQQQCFLHPGGLLKLFQQFELRARNREIARMYPENVMYHYSDQIYHADKHYDSRITEFAYGTDGPLSQQSERISRVNYLDGLNMFHLQSLMIKTGDANQHKTPIVSLWFQVPFSYFQRMGNALLTSFAEDITYNLICGSSPSAEGLGQLGLFVKPGAISVTPYYHWIQPRPEEMAKLRQQMLASPTGIPRLQFSCLSEGSGEKLGVVIPGTGIASFISMKLNCPYPVARTLVWIQSDVGLTGLNVPSRPHTVTIPISQIEVSGSGTTFLTMSEPMLLQQMVDPPHSKTVGQRMIYAINWSLLDKNIEMGGFLPTRNLNNLTLKASAFFPKAVIDASEVEGGNTNNPRTEEHYRLRVIHEYYVIEQTIPSNGQVNVTAFD
jgi:hypothetical protein